LTNQAKDPLVAYTAAPEDLFTAQRAMRERGETLFGIYHSHPRSADPYPSATDVELAYYPEASYLIIGLGAESPVIRGFVIDQRESVWRELPLELVG
jgi:proteasome lid subunit RPN8/RPN11